MNDMLIRYNNLIEGLDRKQRKYSHSKSLRNFIFHLDELELVGYKYNIENKINDYLEFIEQNAGVIDRHSTTQLFTDYIVPIGKTYQEIGFKEISPLEYPISFTIPIDLLVGILFLKFPYPILTTLLLLNYFFRQRKYYKVNKVYGMLY